MDIHGSDLDKLTRRKARHLEQFQYHLPIRLTLKPRQLADSLQTEQRPANNVWGNNHSLSGSGEKYTKYHDADALAYARAESNPALFVPAVGLFVVASEEGMAVNSRFLAAMFDTDGRIISRV